MKKILFLIPTLFLAASISLAQGPQGGPETDNNSENPNQEQSQEGQGTGEGQQVQTEQEIQNQGEEENIMIQEREQEQVQEEEQGSDDLIIAPPGSQKKAQTVNELKAKMQEKEQEMNQETQQLQEKQQKVYQNQNQVRLAVHSLLGMEDLVGGIGPQVSQVAQDFNNSVQATIRAEEKIQNRNRIVRFFAGGDREAAGEIEQEVNRNRERIQQLRQLKEQCDCDNEVQAIFQEQIMNMEQEQNRLDQLAQNEKEYQWVLGRFLNWLGRLF